MREHYETFRAHVAARRDGQGLPPFVERAFQDFLTCGCLAAGFARFRCAACRQERLVAFSCKGRGFCPSCGGRRMTERAAHLVDYVFPDVPVRQWVLTLPSRMRYTLAPTADADSQPPAADGCGHVGRVGRRPNRAWAELMERSFGFDVLACPRCTGRLTLVALIRDAAVVGRILRHLGLPDAVPVPCAGRAPPLQWEADIEAAWSGAH